MQRVHQVPTIKSAKKRLRQSEKRRERNKGVRSEIRTRTRRILETEDAEQAATRLKELYRLLDRAAGRGIIHPNAAARKKARAARHVETLSA